MRRVGAAPERSRVGHRGAGEDGILASAELFGSSGTFSPVAPMNDARADHAAVTLDDGRVLVVGGQGLAFSE